MAKKKQQEMPEVESSLSESSGESLGGDEVKSQETVSGKWISTCNLFHNGKPFAKGEVVDEVTQDMVAKGIVTKG